MFVGGPLVHSLLPYINNSQTVRVLLLYLIIRKEKKEKKLES